MQIIRYKKDLRIQDHQPLTDAIASGDSVIAVYSREPSILQADDFSHFHQYWIQESLSELTTQLNQLHIPLLIRYGETLELFAYIQSKANIHHIYAHEETGNKISYDRDKKVIKRCINQHIQLHETPSNGVVRRLSSRDNRSQSWNERIITTPIIQAPILSGPGQQDFFASDLVQELSQRARETMQSYTYITKPSTRIYPHDVPGETQGHTILNDFLMQKGREYSFSLSSPSKSVQGSSRLSAYLTYGNLSQRRVYQAFSARIRQLKGYQDHNLSDEKKKRLTYWLRSLRACVSRIHWRCHFVQKLESRPRIEYKNQNSGFDHIRTEINHELIQKRYDGTTGIPLVDAGMRCLHSTGWINFRMRAMLVSFICNTCLQPWQAIGPMLAKLFVDYEPGIHYSQLQMQAGTTGINTIRIYNPLKQQEDKDEDLTFIRRRVPEYGSENYPSPIVDIVSANREARKILRSVNRLEVTKIEAKKVYTKLGSRKKSKKTTTKKEKKIIQTEGLFDIV